MSSDGFKWSSDGILMVWFVDVEEKIETRRSAIEVARAGLFMVPARVNKKTIGTEAVALRQNWSLYYRDDSIVDFEAVG